MKIVNRHTHTHRKDENIIPPWHTSYAGGIITASCFAPVPYYIIYCKLPWPSCSKLMTSLVNVLMNFQKLLPQICQYFC